MTTRNGPLEETLAPNDNVILMNANDGNAVVIGAQGHQVAKRILLSKGSGGLFRAMIALGDKKMLLVNDGINALKIGCLIEQRPRRMNLSIT